MIRLHMNPVQVRLCNSSDDEFNSASQILSLEKIRITIVLTQICIRSDFGEGIPMCQSLIAGRVLSHGKYDERCD
uniref:Uncharacterized protein n=1 Tax=Argulus foliaceus TaxID=509924 RepID=A0A7R9NS13_9CRUS